jgi:hypothetical protein
MRPHGNNMRASPIAPAGSIFLKVFYRFLPSISPFFRRRRMRAFTEIVKIKPGTRVLDLGGAPRMWEVVSVPLEITILNLPGSISLRDFENCQNPPLRHHIFHFVEGDACNVHQFGERSFDIVFSNSVIEHVGPGPKQAEFAREVLRLGRSYWVQTPSKWFPVEAHSGIPFYWLYPEWLRAALIRSWRKRLPAWWADYIDSTTVLSRRRLAELFPNGRIRVEYFLGFPKSYVSYYVE